MTSLDMGSGLGKPSESFSQYLFDGKGIHLGIELDPLLFVQCVRNVQGVTTKGLANVAAGKFRSDYVEKHGVLNTVRPPNCGFVCGDIVSAIPRH